MRILLVVDTKESFSMVVIVSLGCVEGPPYPSRLDVLVLLKTRWANSRDGV